MLPLLYLLPKYLLDGRYVHDPQAYRLARKRTRRKFWKLLLFTAFLMCADSVVVARGAHFALSSYPGVSSVTFKMLVCKEIEGRNYLVAPPAAWRCAHVLRFFKAADFGILCSDDQWKEFIPVVVVMVRAPMV